jgi:sensor domain CHASE-containing protein
MSGSIRSWIEIGSVLVLVGGLVLVSVQIKQSTDITRIQLETSLRQHWRTVDSTRQSEEFAKVLAKSIEQPQDLTLAEFFELDAYYIGVTDQLQTLAVYLHPKLPQDLH